MNYDGFTITFTTIDTDSYRGTTKYDYNNDKH